MSDRAACLVMPNSDPGGRFLGYLSHVFPCRHLNLQHLIIKEKKSYFDVMVNQNYLTELLLNKANDIDTNPIKLIMSNNICFISMVALPVLPLTNFTFLNLMRVVKVSSHITEFL